MALVDCYAINIREDVERMDTETLEEHLIQAEIDYDDFMRRVVKYKCFSYAMINEYFQCDSRIDTIDEASLVPDLSLESRRLEDIGSSMYTQIHTSLSKAQEIAHAFDKEGLTIGDYEMLLEHYVPLDKQKKIKELSDYLYNKNIAPFINTSKGDIKDLITITNKIK